MHCLSNFFQIKVLDLLPPLFLGFFFPRPAWSARSSPPTVASQSNASPYKDGLESPVGVPVGALGDQRRIRGGAQTLNTLWHRLSRRQRVCLEGRKHHKNVGRVPSLHHQTYLRHYGGGGTFPIRTAWRPMNLPRTHVCLLSEES